MNQRKYASQPRGGLNHSNNNGNFNSYYFININYLGNKKKKKK